LAIKYLDSKRIRGLSSDTKPTNVVENTIFDETDTYLQWWLQDGAWKRNGKSEDSGNAICASDQSSSTDKTEVATDYTWAVGADTNYGAGYAVGCGNKNSFIFCGGNNSATSSQYYNGILWVTTSMGSSERKDTNASAGSGTETIVAGGRNQAGSYVTTNLTWDSSSWTESASLLSGHGEHCSGDGNYSDFIVVGGYTAALQVAKVSIWNGSSYASGAPIDSAPTAVYAPNVAGLSSSAIHMTGGAPESSNNEATFNGTTWTGTGESQIYGGAYGTGGGSQTAHLYFAGMPSGSSTTSNRLWNGDAWVTKDPLSSARHACAGDCSGGVISD